MIVSAPFVGKTPRASHKTSATIGKFAFFDCVSCGNILGFVNMDISSLLSVFLVEALGDAEKAAIPFFLSTHLWHL